MVAAISDPDDEIAFLYSSTLQSRDGWPLRAPWFHLRDKGEEADEVNDYR